MARKPKEKIETHENEAAPAVPAEAIELVMREGDFDNWQPENPSTFLTEDGLLRAGAGAKIEVFNGNDWHELEQRRPLGTTTVYHLPKGMPEAYMRADKDWVVLWPAPISRMLVRVTMPEGEPN